MPVAAIPALRTAMLLAAASLSSAQTVTVFSEFQRLGPQGEVIDLDQGAKSRELLSPAWPRNAFSTIQVLVDVPAGRKYALHLGFNPENAFGYNAYRAVPEKLGNRWVPDRLQPVSLPVEVKSDGPAVYWIDFWVDRNAPVRRVKVEPELYVEGDWVIYPMEVRVMNATVPDDGQFAVPLPPPDKPADATLLALLRTRLCDGRNMGKPASKQAPATIRDLWVRNAAQDAALAGSTESMWSMLGAVDRKAWCAAATPVRPAAAKSPEWILRARDRLIQVR